MLQLKLYQMNKKILNHFRINDPILHSYALQVELSPTKKDSLKNYFYRLCREIICQQLSDRAGEAIFNRFQKLFSNNTIVPSDVLSISHEKLRASGMSNAKARYVKNLADSVIKKELNFSSFDSLTDIEIVKELTKVKGIGPWTAEMFLMFVLGRENIFSHGDLGLKKGIIKVYKLKKEPTKKQVEKIISQWSPYKTYGSRILWASLEL